MSASADIARAACLWRPADRFTQYGSVHLGRPEDDGRSRGLPFRCRRGVPGRLVFDFLKFRILFQFLIVKTIAGMALEWTSIF